MAVDGDERRDEARRGHGADGPERVRGRRLGEHDEAVRVDGDAADGAKEGVGAEAIRDSDGTSGERRDGAARRDGANEVAVAGVEEAARRVVREAVDAQEGRVRADAIHGVAVPKGEAAGEERRGAARRRDGDDGARVDGRVDDARGGGRDGGRAEALHAVARGERRRGAPRRDFGDAPRVGDSRLPVRDGRKEVAGRVDGDAAQRGQLGRGGDDAARERRHEAEGRDGADIV